MKHLFISAFLFSWLITSSQPKSDQITPLPIIDMHMHAMKANAQGPPPITFCLPRTELPFWDQRKPYAESVFKFLASGDPCTYRIKSPLKVNNYYIVPMYSDDRRLSTGIAYGLKFSTSLNHGLLFRKEQPKKIWEFNIKSALEFTFYDLDTVCCYAG